MFLTTELLSSQKKWAKNSTTFATHLRHMKGETASLRESPTKSLIST